MSEDTRTESDSLGEMQIPASVLWGPNTQRAMQNFPISGFRFEREFIRALGLVKRVSAEANLALGLLDAEVGDAVLRACDDVVEGRLDEHFPVDVFQTGSGTSTNMNANEVIANRAIQLLGGRVGTKTPVHPNDHVNLCQSSNDVFPTAFHVAAVLMVEAQLEPALSGLKVSLTRKAESFDAIVKTGRTHLQDAVPIRLGQVFSGYAEQVGKAMERAERAQACLLEIPLGGTAVGTGINRHEDFPRHAIQALHRATGAAFREAANPFEANAARDGAVEASGELKTIAVSLYKIANDLRWLGSGPRAGLNEIRLPEVQPGSSIMPGKVNPVMAEALIMAVAEVIGNDAAITLGGLGGHFELNLMMPLMAFKLLGSIRLLANAALAFTLQCVSGIEANEIQCSGNVANSLALATALAPAVGYDKAAEICRAAWESGKSIREAALERELLSAADLDRLLEPRKLTEPGLRG